MKSNMNSTDRVVRVILAAVLAALYFLNVITGTVGIILLLLAVVFLLTSIFKWCPLYKLFGLSTAKKTE